MKKFVILGGIGLASFVVGTLVLFTMMPKIAPEVVERTRLRLDSMAAVAAGVPPDSVAVPDSVRRARAHDLAISTMEDSLHAVRERLRDAQTERGTLLDDAKELRAQLETVQKKLETLQSLDVDAENLSQTLAKLEGPQLGQILKDLDLQILELLYAKSSARNQAKLLQAMTPERAARFIHTIVRGTPPPPPTSEAADRNAPETVPNESTQP